MEGQDFEAEERALKAELDAISQAADELAQRPNLEGAAVEAIRREELQAIQLRMAAVKRHSEALTARVEQETARLKQMLGHPGQLPGLLGWIARRHWAFGLTLGLLVPVVWTASAAIAGTGAQVGPEFYAVAAQVIPVVVLAIALESRILEGPTRMPAINAFYVGLLAWIVAGEAAALAAVADQDGTGLTFGMTVLSLAYGALVLVVALSARSP